MEQKKHSAENFKALKKMIVEQPAAKRTPEHDLAVAAIDKVLGGQALDYDELEALIKNPVVRSSESQMAWGDH
jgi:hypothetical protein